MNKPKTIIGNKEEKTDLGAVKIRAEVVSAIASVAVSEVAGVEGIKKDLVSGVLRVFGKKSIKSRRIKVHITESGVKINLSIIVGYGEHIPTIAKKVQENVKKSVSQMTGFKSVEINVNVKGLSLEGGKDENI